MKKLIFAVAAATAAISFAVAMGQGTLAGFTKALGDAKSLNVKISSQVIGGAPETISMDFAKPNKARIETATKLIIADGSKITTLDKKANSYFSKPQNAASFKNLFKGDALQIWSAFFDGKAITPVSVKDKGNRTMRGESFKVVEATMDNQGRRVITFFLDSNDIAKTAQVAIKDQGVNETTVINAESVKLGSDEGDAALFAFNPPTDAKEMTEAEMNSATWYYDLEEAKKAAQASNRKIFVDFFATWCGPCKKLDAEVLQTEQFKEYGKYFVFCKIDVDAQQGVAQHYGITAMPTQMVLDANGGVLGKTVGYGAPAGFYSFIDQYK